LELTNGTIKMAKWIKIFKNKFKGAKVEKLGFD